MRSADGPGGFLTDLVDNYRRYKKACGTVSADIHILLLSRCTHGQRCDLPSCEILLSIMNTCGCGLLHLPRFLYLVIHLFISTPLLLWKWRLAWVEENGDLRMFVLLTSSTPHQKTLVAHFSSAHFITVEANSSKQNPDCWDTCINNDATCSICFKS